MIILFLVECHLSDCQIISGSINRILMKIDNQCGFNVL